MFVPTRSRRRRPIAVALAVGIACAAAPVAAQAATPVNLGTAQSFVVLAGATVTNTGPSVLNGDLGVAPGTALVGFGLPAVVNGATHSADAVAAQAQLDLTTAYNVAAGQAVAPANDLTGTDLGNRTLKAGAYRFTSSAQLTGPLTLDAEGDPAAQFVFEIASSLTTASASSVVLLNGANPCNVFWQVGSSATLGTTTAFQGNLMALASVSLNNGATVIGRVLARNGQVSLINNVIDGSRCGTEVSPSLARRRRMPASSNAATETPAARAARLAVQANQATSRRSTVSLAAFHEHAAHAARDVHLGVPRRRARPSHQERRLQPRRQDDQSGRQGDPSKGLRSGTSRAHNVTARVTFKDATKPKTLELGYRACADAVLHPATGPSQFTG